MKEFKVQVSVTYAYVKKVYANDDVEALAIAGQTSPTDITVTKNSSDIHDFEEQEHTIEIT